MLCEPRWGCPHLLSLSTSARPQIWVLVLCLLQVQDGKAPPSPAPPLLWDCRGCGARSGGVPRHRGA